MVHLLHLPKDIVSYILSLVVYNRYVEEYASDMDIQINVAMLCSDGRFKCRYSVSGMTNLMRTLNLVHPLFRSILHNACIFGSVQVLGATETFSSFGERKLINTPKVYRCWCFKEQFFHTLMRLEPGLTQIPLL